MFKLKHKNLLIIGAVLAGTMLANAAPKTATALQIEEECPDGYSVRFSPGVPGQDYADKCADHQTGTIASDKAEAVEAAKGGTTGQVKGNCRPDNGKDLDKSNCAIISIILNITNILSGIVGVVVVLMIAVGGIQYSASRDNPQATTAAKTRIRNAILALVVYLFMFALLQYLIPGGVL